MKVYYKSKKIDIKVRKVGFFGKTIGLMFKPRSTGNLLFEFRKDLNVAIHSYFVFFPFLILWLNKDDEIKEYGVVMPFNISVFPKRKFRKFVELPLNIYNEPIFRFFVGEKKDLNIR